MFRIKQFIKANPKKCIGVIALLLFLVYNKITVEKQNKQLASYMEEIVLEGLPVGSKIISQQSGGGSGAWFGVAVAGVKVEYEPVKGASIKSIISSYCQYFSGLGGWYEARNFYEYSCNKIKISRKQSPAVKTVGEKKYHRVMFCESRVLHVHLLIESDENELKVEVSSSYRGTGYNSCRLI